MKYGMGSATRREANGAGQYRRLFDHDHEGFAVIDEVGYQLGMASDALKHKANEVADGIGKLKDEALEGLMSIPGNAANATLEAGKDVLGKMMPKGLGPFR